MNHNGNLNLREQIARIDGILLHNEQMRQRMQDDQSLNPARLRQILADHDRTRQEIRRLDPAPPSAPRRVAVDGNRQIRQARRLASHSRARHHGERRDPKPAN
jgi:hypothetical protein